MLRHLWDFVVSVLHHWGALVTGGIVVAVIAVYERTRRKSITGWPFWVAIAVSFFVACFLAWQDERVKVERSGSDLISLTPEELVGVYRERTTAQGEILAEVYVGKWIQVSGAIVDIRNEKGFSGEARVIVNFRRDRVAIFMTFESKWTHQFSALRSGDKITVLGQIERVEADDVWLENCELKEIPHGQSEAK